MNPLKLIKGALGSLAGRIPLVGGLVQSLLKETDDAIAKMTPEQRASFELALKKDATENFKAALSDSADLRKLAMAELEHPGIRWVRPGILAGLFLIIVFWTVIVPLVEAVSGVNIPPPDLSAVPDQLWWLFGVSYVGWGSMREYGKKNKLKALGGMSL